MTWQEYYKEKYPNLTSDQISHILWEQTCFPLGDNDMIEPQFDEFMEKYKDRLDEYFKIVLSEDGRCRWIEDT